MGRVPFSEIPSDLRVPMFYSEVSATGATGPSQRTTLLIGQRREVGTVRAEEIVDLVRGQADGYFGAGSVLARMAEKFFLNHPTARVKAIAVDDESGSVMAYGSIAVSGTASESGTIYLYLGGRLVQAGVAEDDTAAEVAAAICAATNTYGAELASGTLTEGHWYEITARTDGSFTTDGAPVNTVGCVFEATGHSVTLDAGNKVKEVTNSLAVVAQVLSDATTTVTFKAKNKGTLGNFIDIRSNYLKAMSGQTTPDGLTLTITPMAHGATDPLLDDVITAMGDNPYYGVVHPYGDATSLNTVKTEINSRWLWNRQIYGASWSFRDASYSDLIVLGESRNGLHEFLPGAYRLPTPPDEAAAIYAGAALRSLESDPALPVWTLELIGMLAPDVEDRFTMEEMNTLLHTGISTVAYGSADPGAACYIGRAISTYRLDAAGVETDAWLDCTDSYIPQNVVERLSSVSRSTLARKKLRDDSSIPLPANTVEPRTLHGMLVAEVGKMASDDGWLENVEAFKQSLIVERNATNRKRVDAYLAPDKMDQLALFALAINFI